jgi:hypothetical protein
MAFERRKPLQASVATAVRIGEIGEKLQGAFSKAPGSM